MPNSDRETPLAAAMEFLTAVRVRFTLRGDGTLWVPGNLVLKEQAMTELPDLTMVEVEGTFDCSENSLTSLKGSPRKVGKDFICRNNNLTSLEGASPVAGGAFICTGNKLVS